MAGAGILALVAASAGLAKPGSPAAAQSFLERRAPGCSAIYATPSSSLSFPHHWMQQPVNFSEWPRSDLFSSRVQKLFERVNRGVHHVSLFCCRVILPERCEFLPKSARPDTAAGYDTRSNRAGREIPLRRRTRHTHRAELCRHAFFTGTSNGVRFHRPCGWHPQPRWPCPGQSRRGPCDHPPPPARWKLRRRPPLTTFAHRFIRITYSSISSRGWVSSSPRGKRKLRSSPCCSLKRTHTLIPAVRTASASAFTRP